MELIEKLRADTIVLHNLAKQINWIAKDEIHTRIRIIREHIIDVIKKLKEDEE